MQQIVQSILTSKTPIAVYIAPNGARAASAGTYIVYASTIAAMAPSTHLGAATPVRVANGFNENEKAYKHQGAKDVKIKKRCFGLYTHVGIVAGAEYRFCRKSGP